MSWWRRDTEVEQVTINGLTTATEEKIVKQYEERKAEEARINALNAYTRNYMPGSSIAIPTGKYIHITEPGGSGTYIYTLEGMMGKVLGYTEGYEINHLIVQISVGKYIGTVEINPHISEGY